jgi:hypothetical protein
MNLQHEFPLGALGVVADGAMAAVGGWERHRVAPQILLGECVDGGLG